MRKRKRGDLCRNARGRRVAEEERKSKQRRKRNAKRAAKIARKWRHQQPADLPTQAAAESTEIPTGTLGASVSALLRFEGAHPGTQVVRARGVLDDDPFTYE